VTVSAGVGIYPKDGEQAQQLMNSAGRALAEAKREGKNDYCIAVQTDSPPLLELK
jgi:GGDEF domain-containing protein